jgi:hypothetical protein
MAWAKAHEVQTRSAVPQSRNTGPRIFSTGMTATGVSVGYGSST